MEMENFVSKVKIYFMLSTGGFSLTSLFAFFLIMTFPRKGITPDTNNAVGVHGGEGD